MIRSQTIQKLNPASDALLIALARLVDDSMLEEIAAADYDTGTEENLTQLRRIRDNHEVLAPMPFGIREVMNLTRWSEPDRDHPNSDDQHRRGHIIRAFACIFLLRANVEPSNQDYDGGENETLAQLLASLVVIGSPFHVAALRFIAWRAQDLTGSYEDDPFYILALLVLTLRTQADLTVHELQEVIDCLYVFEKQARQEQIISSNDPEPWLLGVTNFDQRHKVWKQIGKEIGTLAVNYKDPSIEAVLLDIAKRLVGDSIL